MQTTGNHRPENTAAADLSQVTCLSASHGEDELTAFAASMWAMAVTGSQS